MSSDTGAPRRGGLCAVGVTKRYGPRRGRVAGLGAAPAGTPGSVAALDGLDLEVGPGEVLGIVGPNGSGKSTFLKVVAGVVRPTSGAVAVRGVVGSMIELGLGFHPDLTGMENIWCSGVVMGFDRATVAAAVGPVADFCGLGRALEDPLRTYSTGMAARLGFAVATHLPVDVLAVDEVLSVGDEDFQARCLEKVRELSALGVTVLFVSHELPLVAAVCGRAVQLRAGRIVDDGPAAEVVERYLTTAPSRFRRAPSSPLSIEGGALSTVEAPDGTRVHLDLDLSVARPLDDVVAAVDMELPTVAPGVVWSTSSSPVGRVGEGRFRLRGVSTPVPVASGMIRVLPALVDGRTQQLLDVARHDLVLGDRPGAPVADVAVTFQSSPTAARVVGRAARTAVADPVVRVDGAVKTFRLRGAKGRGRVVALDGLDLEVGRGTSLGIIGPNGSGKSTLLRAVAGIAGLDAGTVRTAGRVVPVLDLGPGFHPELSGRENVVVAAGLLGLARDEVARVVDATLDAAELGDAVDRPVRTFSSGMRARLGFALATSSSPDVLLVDELLAVGDEDFRRAALERVVELRDGGTTVMFVSHDLRLVGEFCDRVVRIEQGRVVDDGEPDEVVERYGGPSWVSGTSDAVAPVRVHDLRVRPHHVAQGGRLELGAVVEVTSGDPWHRLVLSYRVQPMDRDAPLTAAEVEQRSFMTRTLEPVGGFLSGPGWFEVSATVDRNNFAGRFDLVVSVVDDRTGEVLCDAWESVLCGREAPNGTVDPAVVFDWTVDPLDG